MSMLQGNATKALRAATDNIAKGVFSPLGQLLYNTNMLYSSNEDVKGDSQIVTKGAEGILQQEMEKQSAMEILQVISAAGAQMANMGVNLAPVMGWGVKKLIGAMGVPDDIITQMEQMPSMPAMQSSPSPVGNGNNPNPNPAPPSPTGAGVAADVTGA